jgi:hypothetical protein
MSMILVNISKVDFEIVDEEDAGLLAIHNAFKHSQLVAEAHYALQSTNALIEISHTAVSSMQRVSKRWHTIIGQFQSGAQKPPPESHSAELNYEKKLFNRLLGPLKTTIHNATQQTTVSMEVDIANEFKNVATGMGSSILRKMNNMFHQYIHALHLNLIECLHPLFLGQPFPSFTSPQQAEVMQSCMTSDHVVCVMPTSSGKSLIFFAVSILIPNSLFIVVTSLVTLTEDLVQRLSSTTIPDGQYHHVRNILSMQIIIVSAH